MGPLVVVTDFSSNILTIILAIFFENQQLDIKTKTKSGEPGIRDSNKVYVWIVFVQIDPNEANLTCQFSINATPPPRGRHCAGTWDGVLCWGAAPANSIAHLPCPDLPGSDPTKFGHKECLANGSWLIDWKTGNPRTDYSECTSHGLLQQHQHDIVQIEDQDYFRTIYVTGFIVSLVSLIFALAIHIYLKWSHGTRCSVLRVSLLTSFLLVAALWLAWHFLAAASPLTLAASPTWCRALNTALQYALLSNYSWMLCKVVRMHPVLVTLLVSKRRLRYALLAAGWLLPLPSLVVYVARHASQGNELCWLKAVAPQLELSFFQCVTLVVSVVMVVHTAMCSLVMRDEAKRGSLLAAAALIVMVAMQFALELVQLPLHFATRWERPLHYVLALGSLQGFLVALLYCFSDSDVQAAVAICPHRAH